MIALCVVATAADAQQSRRRPGDRVGAETPVEPAPPPAESTPPPPAAPRPATAAPPASEDVPAREAASPTIGGRRRPGQPDYTRPTASGERLADQEPSRLDRVQPDPNRNAGLARIDKPAPDARYGKEAIADRWRLTQQLGLTNYPWWDPYHQNTLKADRPVFGRWFFNVTLVSDTQVEPRSLPIPVAPQGENGAGNFGAFGDPDQLLLGQSIGAGLVFYQGDTTFRPPDWEFRFTPVYNFNRAQVEQNRALRIDPQYGNERTDNHVGVQELFVDKHLYDVSARYDFDSLRLGIQSFNVDFRGFLFRDEQLGLRWFGNRANNVLQYNVAAFRRIEKDTNSGLNDLGQKLRADDVFVANVYWQDSLALGYTSEALILHNRNREGDEGTYFDKNGFIQRPFSFGLEKPRNYDVTYFGLAGEGHIGRLNLSTALYQVLGDASRGVFVDRPVDIAAFLAAVEASIDHDWQRYRLSLLWASGDSEPYDDRETGFDAVFENPLFAGADTSFWIRQNVPLVGGGGVFISSRNGLLNALRSSREEGQSNFANPGTALLGLGVDLDLTPRWRISANLNELAFVDTSVIETARQQSDVDRHIGTDLSVATIWRPKFSQNIVFRGSAATLVPGKGYEELFGDELPYSVLLNLILTY